MRRAKHTGTVRPLGWAGCSDWAGWAGWASWARLGALLAGAALAAAAGAGSGCGEPDDGLNPSDQKPVVSEDRTREDQLTKMFTTPAATSTPTTTQTKSDANVLPIFLIGDDYRMLALPDPDARPAVAGNAQTVPVAFMIPSGPGGTSGRPEKLEHLAVGVLYRDDSQPETEYRLADLARAKLGAQVCRKAFNAFAKDEGAKLPADLTPADGYPAIFSAAYIFQGDDMVEQPGAESPPGRATPQAAQQDKRSIHIIRTQDIQRFLKENDADVLALLVVQVDERNQNEKLMALWLWSRDPVTRTIYTPSACVTAPKIDGQMPEATDAEMVDLWQAMIGLERRMEAQKTVVIDHLPRANP
ncbi:MAG: hypothetical protein ACREJ2_09160 [Planctomycetota bacterium]